MPRLTLTACLLALVCAAPARADVVVLGTGEPEFTNSANNTQWVQWSNNGPYRVEFQHIVDGVTTKVDGPYDLGQTGSTKVNWSGIAGIPLQEGSTYAICGFGRWSDGGLWFPDFSTSCGSANGKRVATTIDRTKPVIALDAPTVTRAAKVPIRIDYTDNLAYPFGVAFVSVDGAPYSVLDGCAPAARKKVTTFSCAVELPADGPHTVCAMVPDAAVPDNPNSSDQSGTAANANRSDPKCREVVLDRVAPQVVLTVPSSIVAGRAALFAASVAGLVGAQWSWGDGTTSTGVDASHVYTAPGTYRVRFTGADAAGNVAEVVRDVVVRAAPVPPAPTPEAPVVTPPPAPPAITPPVVFSVRVERASGKLVRLSVTGASGSARVVLKRGKRVIVSKRVTIRSGRITLKLPRKLAHGRHTVEVVAGGRTATVALRRR